jgi:hypothetical protein
MQRRHFLGAGASLTLAGSPLLAGALILLALDIIAALALGGRLARGTGTGMGTGAVVLAALLLVKLHFAEGLSSTLFIL